MWPHPPPRLSGPGGGPKWKAHHGAEGGGQLVDTAWRGKDEDLIAQRLGQFAEHQLQHLPVSLLQQRETGLRAVSSIWAATGLGPALLHDLVLCPCSSHLEGQSWTVATASRHQVGRRPSYTSSAGNLPIPPPGPAPSCCWNLPPSKTALTRPLTPHDIKCPQPSAPPEPPWRHAPPYNPAVYPHPSLLYHNHFPEAEGLLGSTPSFQLPLTAHGRRSAPRYGTTEGPQT